MKVDTITKDYVKDAGVFADIFNYYIYGGRQAIQPEQLTVERRAADVIEAITNSGIKYDEEDEVVNVCQAIQEMRKESERNGELNKAKEAARNFYNLGIDVEKIAQGVGYAVETVKEWIDLSGDAM